METAVFVISGVIVLGGAGGVILSRNPVHAALSLVASLFGVAVLFVAQEAHLLAAVQVIVYTGAIVVLILFVLMLLGVDRDEDISAEPLRGQRPLAVLLGAGGLLVVAAVLLVPVLASDDDDATVADTVVTGRAKTCATEEECRDIGAVKREEPVVDEDEAALVDPVTGERETREVTAGGTNVQQVGRSLFTDYVFAFEVTALLLTIAVVGAVVMAKRVRDAQELPEPEPMTDLEPLSGPVEPAPTASEGD